MRNLFILGILILIPASLQDNRILRNYEKKLNSKEGQIVGGMVKRYRCIEEYVPIEEAKDFGKKRRKLHGVKVSKSDGNWRYDSVLSDEESAENSTDFFHLPFRYVFEIKPKKFKNLPKLEELEPLPKIKTAEEKAVDEEIEKMLHETESPSSPTHTQGNPIRPQKRRDEKTGSSLFDHEMSRGIPISELSRTGDNQRESGPKRRYQGRQFYVYDFDDNGEFEYVDDEYYDERPRRRGYGRRRFSPPRRNFYTYPQRLPYRGAIQGRGAYIPLQSLQYQPEIGQQVQPQQSYFVQRRQPIALQPLPVARQAAYYPTRVALSTVPPPVVMEPAERVDPAMYPIRKGHPQRAIQPRLKLNQLPIAQQQVQQQLPAALGAGTGQVPAFNKGQLEEATPENCRKITQLSTQFGITDISTWSKKNCPTLQMFVPGATCPQLWHFIDSCHKRRFL